VAKVGTSKAGSTISQLGCGTSVACHGKPIKEKEEEEGRLYAAESIELIFCAGTVLVVIGM
jgi:hypothetical protein